MFGKRVAFWGAVAGVSLAAPFVLQVVSDKVPSLGLRRFLDYSHRSTGGA